MFKTPWVQGLLLFFSILIVAWLVATHATAPIEILAVAFFIGILFFLTYTLKSPFILIIALLGTTTLLTRDLYFIYAASFYPTLALGVIPFLLLIFGQVMIHVSNHRVNSDNHFAIIYKAVGITVVACSLLAMTFDFFHYGFSEIRQQGMLGMAPLWILYLISAVVGAFVVSKESEYFVETLKANSSWLLVDALAFFLLLVPFTQQGLMILMNIFIFIWAISLTMLGRRLQDKVYFYTGPLVLVAAIVSQIYRLL